MRDAFGAFCLVGMGGHARTKLLPALAANGQQVAAVVSKTYAAPGVTVFSDLTQALDALPPDTVFLLASPPSAHAGQARAVAACGFDLFIEKPAFVTPAAAREIAALAQARGAVLAEAMMYRHTALHARLIDYWTRHRARIRALDMTFTIDKMPAGTFRLEDGLAASSAFDIGCYPVSLLADLGLGGADIAVTEVAFPGARDKERVHAAGARDAVRFTLDYGVAPAYANTVRITLDDGTATVFTPFFYGRPGDRRIETGGHIETLAEPDAFRTMLARPRAAWLADQPARNLRLVNVTAKLEALAQAVAAWPRSPEKPG